MSRRLRMPSTWTGRAVLPAGLLLLAAAVLVPPAQAASVRPAPVLVDSSWMVPGDYDGDGRTDLAQVDSHSGALRIWYGEAGGGWTLGPPGPTGLAGVSHAVSARLVAANRDDLVMSSTFGNRLVVRPGAARGVEPAPISLAVEDLGPTHLAALQPGRTAGYGDLAVHTTLDYTFLGVGGPFRLRTYGRSAGTFTAASLAADEPIRPDPQWGLAGLAGLDLGDGEAAWMVAHLRHPNWISARLDLYQVRPGMTPERVQDLAIEGAGAWTAGRFGPAARPGLLLWRTGLNSFNYRPHASEPAPGGWSEAIQVPLPLYVSTITVIAEGDPGLLLVVSSDSQVAQLGSFDGTSFAPLGAPMEAASGRYHGGVVALGGGRFSLLDRDHGQGVDPRWRTYDTAGGAPALLDERPIGALSGASALANVMLFAGDPLDPLTGGELRELRRVGDWTREAIPAGGAVSVQVQSDRGLPLGLGPVAGGFAGGVPAGVTHALPNQLSDGVSLTPRAVAEGVPLPRVTLSPPPGRYPHAVRVEPVAPWPGAVLRVRRGQNFWANYSPAAPLVVTETTTFMVYAVDPVTGSPGAITFGEYVITQPDRRRDSDGDGVPDFVELWYGLDPLASGRDGDGDGMSDLREILLGSDPTNPDSIADDTYVAAFDERTQFRLRLGLQAQQPAGDAQARRAPAAGLPVGVRSATGERRDGVSTGGAGAEPAEVLVAGIPRGGAAGLPWVVARSAPRFVLAADAPDRFRGVELFAVVDEPVATPVEIPWTPSTGQPLANEVFLWRAAAQSVYVMNDPPEADEVEALAGPEGALVVALLERVLHDLGLEAGALPIGAPPLTLVPDRPGEVGRQPLDPELLERLARPRSLLAPAWRAQDLLAAIRPAATDPAGPLAALVQLNHALHLAAAADSAPGAAAVPLPLDALRAALQPPVPAAPAGEEASPADPVLAAAWDDFFTWRKTLEPRPVLQRVLIWRTLGSGTCQQAYDPLTFETFNLLDRSGRNYVPPGAAPLPDGTRVRITAYTDVTTADCFGSALEVVDLLPAAGGDPGGLAVEVLPGPSVSDQDGNLLADAWELAFFGTTGHDPFADPDGAGLSLLQRYLEGLDPADTAAAAAVTPVDLRPPLITIEEVDDYTVRLRWRYPDAYADLLSFEVESSEDLRWPFYSGYSEIQPPMGGEWSADVSSYYFEQGFFRLRLRIRFGD